MMEPRTPQSSLTIILLPAAQVGADCMAVASAWAVEGLLKRALWVTAERIVLSAFGTVTASGMLIDQGQTSEQDILAVLSRSRVELVTVVVLQIAASDGQLQAEQHRAAEALVQAIDHSRPEVLNPGDEERPIDVVRLNLLCAPTGTMAVPYEASTFRFFNANVLASPEDRRAADQMDQFVRQGENLIPWAVAQGVTLGGVWSGMSEGPWRLLRDGGDDSSMAQSDFSVPFRGFARVVTSAPTARRALALAMEEIRDQPTNVVSVAHLVPTAEPGQFLDATLEALDLVDGGRLEYETPTAVPPPGKEKVPLGQAFKDFLSFSRTELISVPRLLSQRASAKWSARATKALSGEDGNEVITVRGESPDLMQFKLEFERQAIDAKRNLENIKSSLPPAAPTLWRTIRSTAFGLLDGSPIPEPIPTPIVADQRVVIPATTLIAPPLLDWLPDPENGALRVDPADLPVPAASPWHAARVHHQISQDVAEQEAGAKQARVSLESARQSLASWQVSGHFDDADSSESSATEDAGDDEADSPSGISEVDRALRTAELTVAVQQAADELARAEGRLAELHRHVDSFAAWMRDREQSLLWRLAQRLQTRTIQAGEDATAFRQEAVSIPSIDQQEPLRARNQFANRLVLLGSLTLVAVLLLWRFAGPLAELLSLPTWSPWVVLLMIVGFFLIMIHLSFYRRRSRFVARLRALRHEQRDAQRRCIEATHAENRLNGLYQQMIEWNELLGHSIHDPLHPEASWFSGLPSAELAAQLPSCVDLAVPDPDDAPGTLRLQRSALESITGEGWRARTFNLLLDLSLAGQAVKGADAESALIDMDAPATPNGTRRSMVGQLRSGELQAEAAKQVMRRKAAGLYAERQTLMSHALRPVNSEYAAETTDLLDEDSGLEMLRPTWGDFLMGALKGNTQFSSALWSDAGSNQMELRLSMRTLVFTPPGMDMSWTPKAFHQVPAAAADKNRGVELSVRCDFGRPAEAKMLRIFSQDRLVEDPVTDVSTSTQGSTGNSSTANVPLDMADFN